MERLIGFCGYKGSGKTTAAKTLVDQKGYTRLRFAGPMKEMIGVLLRRVGYDEEEIKNRIDGPMKNAVVPDVGATPRHMLQTLGTEWGRECIDKNLWANITLAEAQQTDGPVVIDDCRFPNEAKLIDEFGGMVVRIDRGLENNDSHESERHIEEIDADRRVMNDGSVRDLREKILML